MANIANDEVFTPAKIVNDVLDLLPNDVWNNKNLKWLNPACKNGAWLREIYYRLFKGLEHIIPNELSRKIHILGNMIFGYSTSDVAWMLVCRTLYAENKIKTVTNSENVTKTVNVLSWKDSPFCNNIIDKRFLDEDITSMPKFDIIVGNPPYQKSDKKDMITSAIPLYHEYVMSCISLNPTLLSMIIPSRWMAGGKGLSNFRQHMITDHRIKIIKDHLNSMDIFPDVDVIGGVMYFVWDTHHDGSCEYNGLNRMLDGYDIVVRNEISLLIISKIPPSYISIKDTVNSRNCFDLETNHNKWDDKSNILCYTSKGIKRIYISEFNDKNHILHKYKVCCCQAGDGPITINEKRYNILSTLFIAKPNELCTDTYLVVNSFNSRESAECFLTYCKSRFFRFLVSIRTASQHISKLSFSFVPDLQDYTKPWTDEELYKMFNLTQEEIDHIESVIKEMP